MEWTATMGLLCHGSIRSPRFEWDRPPPLRPGRPTELQTHSGAFISRVRRGDGGGTVPEASSTEDVTHPREKGLLR